ncbi:uncharacterized protein LOC101894540 [Musca domestica]|uniref:Uncharacterized protein LOC101894540 n=1 Tax=Musca domestica TaxID=7370 RepID=A0A1I8NBZ8_MUSDO|nr:uncharacterized protein LOC101894540 [Musca domestica]
MGILNKSGWIVFIVVTLAKTLICGPLPSLPTHSPAFNDVNEVVDYYIHNTKLTYDHRAASINEEADNIFQYINNNSNNKGLKNNNKYQKLDDTLKHFMARVNKFNNKCGITDVLMILAPRVLHEINDTNDNELIALSERFRNLLKLNEVQRQIEAAKKVEEFLDGKETSIVLQFHSKYTAWDREYCYGVSVWDE